MTSKDWFKIRNLNIGDFFVYIPEGQNNQAYAYIEKSLNQWNFVVVTFNWNGSIVRDKMGKNFELYIPEQKSINEYDWIRRIFNKNTKSKYFDYVRER